MEEKEFLPGEIASDTLVKEAAEKVSGSLIEKFGDGIKLEKVTSELVNIKYGILSEDIPLNVLVYKELEDLGINILRKNNYEPPIRRTFVNSPVGRTNQPSGFIQKD